MKIPAPERRSFLFLQGMASQFFSRLGRAMESRGHAVHRINFNAGDRLFWPLPGAADFRGGLDCWPRFLERRVGEWAVTDIVLFGDCRPLHRAAVRFAARRGVRTHVFDEGYVRPNYVTLEEGGVNGYSRLPRDPEWFLSAATRLPPTETPIPVFGSFARRATEDVIYNVASVLLSPLYPGYRTHRPWHPFVEYAGWLYKFSRKPSIRRRVQRATAEIEALASPYYLFPLQLDCDSQIRHHAELGRMAPYIERVLVSFRDHAPADASLVVKEHPLDNALTDWRKLTSRIADEMGLVGRVIYIEGGNLDRLLSGSVGVVTVNSTTGILALSFGRPTIALGDAVYDMPGLTFQGKLDEFWRKAPPPDPVLFGAFRRVTVARSQVNGGFFSREGLALAFSNALARMEAEQYFPARAIPSGFPAPDLDVVPIANAA